MSETIEQTITNEFLKEIRSVDETRGFMVGREDYLVGRGVLFGTKYAPWIAEAMGLKDEEKIRGLGRACMYGRSLTIAMDQEFDSDTESSKVPKIVWTGTLIYLFSKTVTSAKDFFPNDDLNKQKRNKASIYVLEAKDLAEKINIFEMIRHTHAPSEKIRPYIATEIDRIGKKTAMISVPPRLVGLLLEHPLEGEKLTEVMYNAIIAIQLCDDIADMEEDFERGFYTAPLAHSFRLREEKERKYRAALKGLFVPGTFEVFLNRSVHYLNRAGLGLINLSGPKDNHISTYFGNLAKRLQQLSKQVAEVRADYKLPKIRYDDSLSSLVPQKLDEKTEDEIVERLSDFVSQVEPKKISPLALGM